MPQLLSDSIALEAHGQTRAILDSLIAFVGILTPDGILIEANQTALAAANLTAADVLGKPFEDAYWWSYSTEIQVRLRAAIRLAAAGETVRYDVPVRVAEDRCILIDFMIVPQKNASGEVIQLIPSAVDITDRERVVQQLRDSETRLRVAMEAAHIGTWEIDLLTDMVWRSESTDMMFGLPYSPELRPLSLFFDRIHSGDADKLATAVRDTEERQGDHYVEYRIVLPSGALRWVASRGVVEKDAEGQPTRLIGALTDITERVRAEHVLRESEDLFRATFDQAAIGIAHIGMQGDWLRVNQALCNIVGYTREELHALTFQDITHPDDLNSDLQLFEDLKQGKIPSYALEKRYFHKNGSIVWIHLQVSMVRDAVPPYCISFVENITERKQQLEQIETLNARLQRAMAETHHRVKNNLQVIAALVEISVGDAEEMVPLASISRIGQHVRTLAELHDLLTQQAKVGESTDTISVLITLERLVNFLRATTGGRAIILDSADIPISVRGGASLALLVNELVANAVKHGKGSIQIAFRTHGGIAELEVSDDGLGFPDDFDPTVAGNTGLTLIESAGQYDLRGTVSYRTRPEGGASVRIVFPLPA